jgi:hypothetical protein
MAYKALNNKGKAFVKKFTDNTDNYLLKGRFKTYNLPNSTISGQQVEFSADVLVNGKFLLNNRELGENIIKWIDNYAKIYALDANIIAAQTSAEGSGNIANVGFKRYVCFAYSPSGAMGISQFTANTVWGMIYRLNKTFTIDKRLTTTEISALLKSLTGDKEKLEDVNSVANRKQLHKNLIDNPEICIKMQCMLMSYIGKNNNNLATSSLYCYNRGSEIKSSTYLEAIKKTTLPIAEGLNYVKTIYEFLVNDFGYPVVILDTLIAEQNGIIAMNNEDINPKLLKLDSAQQKFVNELHYKLRATFTKLILDIQDSTGWKVIITSGYRSFQKQAELQEDDDRNADPGRSHHNYGLGIDINLQKGDKILRKASPRAEWEATGAIQIAKALGFTWGGDFVNYYDPVHFDLKDVYPIDKLVENANLVANNDLTKVQGNKVPLFG